MRGRVGALAALEQGEAFQAFLAQRREELDAQAAAAAAVAAGAVIPAPYENMAIRTTNPRRKLRRHGADRCYEHHEPVYRTELVPAAELAPPPPSQSAHPAPVPLSTLPPPPASSPSAASNATSDDNGATFVSSAYITLKSSQESLLEEPHTRSRLKKMQTMPLSPTHYQQPPTPDHPPPSALQAEKSIHERIRPLSQEYKRRSRDMETETEEELLLALPSLDASSGSLSSSVSLSDKSVSTDNNVEEYFGDAPFAGLFKGSTSQSAELGVRSSPAERPRTLRRLKNVYDGPVVPHDSLGGRVPTSGGGGGGGGGGSSGGGGGGSGGGGGGDKGGSLSILSPFDEQEEWNKISEIMASFGLTHSESGAGSPMATTSLGHWLASLGLLEFESVFRAHGYDDLDFINGVLEEGDLRDMGVSSEKDRSVILEAAHSLPLTVREATAAAEAVEAATAQAQAQAQALAAAAAEGTTNGEGNDDGEEGDAITEAKEAAAAAEAAAEAATRAAEEGAAVDAWLRALRLECYCETFRKHLYTDMARVRRIWEVELTAVLEIGRVGHRRRILSSVGSAGGAPPLSSTGYSSYHRGSGPDLDDLTHDLNQLKNNIQQLKEEIREKLPAPPPASSLPGGPGSTGTLRHSHKKSRPAPPPPTAPPPGTGESPPQATTFPTNGELEIRGPSELLEGVPATLTTRWRHPPHALVTGCVNYVASYLGSTVVKELRGTESTKKSIQKLKKIPRDAATTPDIVLAISYRGVKFLNTLTQVLVCEHEIRNIHCACQDADDLTHFAYITKDHASRSHYCHVFCVHTMDQATEIILTLGQAFEVAYQLALRDQFSSSGGGGGGRGRNGNGHARSQSAAAPAPGLSAAAPSPGGGCGGLAPPASGHARSHSVNEMKLNGLAARETRIGGGGTATSGTTGSPAKASPGANGAAGNAAPLVLKEEL